MIGVNVPAVVNAAELKRKVKDMYTRVALDPQGPFHFDMGRTMARRLGYTDEELDAVPAESIESFAGVGYYFVVARHQRLTDRELRQSAFPGGLV